jgi:hypothetical protein
MITLNTVKFLKGWHNTTKTNASGRRRDFGVCHVRNYASDGIAVEKVSIAKYDPFSNDAASAARALLRGTGTGGRGRTLGCGV